MSVCLPSKAVSPGTDGTCPPRSWVARFLSFSEGEKQGIVCFPKGVLIARSRPVDMSKSYYNDCMAGPGAKRANSARLLARLMVENLFLTQGVTNAPCMCMQKTFLLLHRKVFILFVCCCLAVVWLSSAVGGNKVAIGTRSHSCYRLITEYSVPNHTQRVFWTVAILSTVVDMRTTHMRVHKAHHQDRRWHRKRKEHKMPTALLSV